MKNIFDLSDLALPLKEEHFTDLLKTDNVRIERIVSTGQASPKDFWYDQSQDEWILILQGSAKITTQDKQGKTTTHTLTKGSTQHIPAHQKHRVEYTDAVEPTIWLAVFFG